MVNVKLKTVNVKLIRIIAMGHIKVVSVVVVIIDDAVLPRSHHPNWNLGMYTGIATVGIHSVLMQAPPPTQHLMPQRNNASSLLIIVKVRDYRTKDD